MGVVQHLAAREIEQVTLDFANSIVSGQENELYIFVSLGALLVYDTCKFILYSSPLALLIGL